MYQLTNTNIIIRLSDNANIPIDEGNTDYQAYLDWLADGNVPEPVSPESPQETIARLDAAIEQHIFNVVTGMGYVSVERLTGAYANSTNPKWKAESEGAAKWITAIWETALQIEQDATNGTRPIPSEEELIAEMPKLEEYIIY